MLTACSCCLQEDNAAASEAVVNVLKIEEKFWQMAYDTQTMGTNA